MKDRIRQIMETQHMTQQVFAQLIELAPATLSSIFNGRTRPTLNVVEAIKKKIPDINTEWLLFGAGSMYNTQSAANIDDMAAEEPMAEDVAPRLEFDFSDASFPNPTTSAPQNYGQPVANYNGVRNTRLQQEKESVKNIDKTMRKVTEIRVFYDDLTYESFVPAKK